MNEMFQDIYDDDYTRNEEDDRLVSPDDKPEDSSAENLLRPKYFDDYLGQDKVKETMKIYIEAAKNRNEPLDHVLLYGPPGLGKTTLSEIIANELGVSFRQTSGPAIQKAGDLVALLTNLGEGDVLFIDEIHRLARNVEEFLYSAMEDWVIDVTIGKGPEARIVRIPLKKFTLIGATTRAGQISTPLRDRFGVMLRLELYTPEQLKQIIDRSADILGIEVDEEGALEIASRSRGTPRIANRLLKRVRDYSEVRGNGKIDLATAKAALSMMEIDELGLDKTDRSILETIINFYGGGPVGVETLAATIGEESITIEDVIEPYLMQIGFLSRTPRGRCATKLAYDHLGIAFDPKNSQNIQDQIEMTDIEEENN